MLIPMPRILCPLRSVRRGFWLRCAAVLACPLAWCSFMQVAAAVPIDLGGAFNRDAISTSTSDLAGGTGGPFFLVTQTHNADGGESGSNVPDSGIVTAGGRTYPLGPYIGNNAVTGAVAPNGPAASRTRTINFNDSRIFTDLSVLYLFATTRPTTSSDATNGVTVTYVDNVQESFLWDTAVWTTPSTALPTTGIALAQMDFYRSDTNDYVDSNNLHMYTQLFTLSHRQPISSITFSSQTISGNTLTNAEFAIFAMDATVVPEPTSALLLVGILGFAAFGWRRQRRRRAAAIS